jgi:Ca2+-transporting ATPase
LSLTIYAGLLFACSLAGFCDYIKERQHLSLKDEINNQKVTVYRGAFGTVQSVPVRELVVGDIVDINQGDRVPADCILIDEMNITVDQSMYYQKATQVEKEQSTHTPLFNDAGYAEGDQDNHKEHPDPFLFSDSKIMTGQGKAIVCAVGDNTLMALNRKAGDLQISEQLTFLEEKLDLAAKNIGTYAMAATIVILATQIIFNFIFILSDGNKDLMSNETLLKLGQIGISAVVILVVAIPEGLPLAVSIAMALSITSLKQDEILIKNLESI